MQIEVEREIGLPGANEGNRMRMGQVKRWFTMLASWVETVDQGGREMGLWDVVLKRCGPCAQLGLFETDTAQILRAGRRRSTTGAL